MYSSCYIHSIKGYGKNRWVVHANIDFDYESVKELQLSEQEIVQRCIEYLNTPLKSKYGKKRKRKLPYGKFEPVPYRFKLKEKNNKVYIEAQLIVLSHENKKFWHSGVRL
tara:strand:- start:2319 stop:2648 length:330 start_codon:yes stop_codon:yes gene_type:complete